MPEELKFRDRFIPERVVSKYFQIYQPHWSLSSPEERSDFMKLFFKVLNEYDRRFSKRIGLNNGQENDREVEEKFISIYVDQLKNLRDMNISTLLQKVYDDHIEFLVNDHLFSIQEEILEQCRMNPESSYSKFQMSLVEKDRGNYDKALSIVNEFLAKEPNSITFLAMAGSIFEKIRKYEIALSKYDRAYKLTIRNLGSIINDRHFSIDSHFRHDREFLLLYRIRCCLASGHFNQALKDAAILDSIIEEYLTDENLPEFGYTAGEILKIFCEDGARIKSLCPEEYKELSKILGEWEEMFARPPELS